jgi:hypothetical protein
MKIILYLTAFLLMTSTVQAQEKENVWSTLSKVTYIKKYDEFLGFKIDVPVFAEDVKNLDGAEISLLGYIIPVEGYKSHKEFIFSAFPYNMCFFCGGAGPETVMEVRASEAIKYQAEAIRLRGTLRLNDEDVNSLMYAIEDAVKID